MRERERERKRKRVRVRVRERKREREGGGRGAGRGKGRGRGRGSGREGETDRDRDRQRDMGRDRDREIKQTLLFRANQLTGHRLTGPTPFVDLDVHNRNSAYQNCQHFKTKRNPTEVPCHPNNVPRIA